MFLWNILLKDCSSFVQHDNFVHSTMFCRIVQFTKFAVQCVKNLSYFPKSVSLGRHGSEGRHWLKGRSYAEVVNMNFDFVHYLPVDYRSRIGSRE